MLQLLTRNIMTKLVALFILGTPFIAIGGALYKQAAKETTWKQALFKSYAVLQNVPGIILIWCDPLHLRIAVSYCSAESASPAKQDGCVPDLQRLLPHSKARVQIILAENFDT